MKHLVFAATFLSALSAFAQEEFAGPFPSWTSIRAYGAVGNGTADDTAAIQAALSELGRPGKSPVLYFPAGTYAVSKPLLLAGRIYVSILGESPDTVSLKWTGPAGDSLLRVNGVAYSRVNRITFDGSHKAAVLIDQSWDGKDPHFDTGNEYSDDVFTGASIGIRGGERGFGFAETAVIRGKFLSLPTGIVLKNFNALDLWVWDSLFDHCGTGITNNPGAGNWHVYNSTFLHSSMADNSVGHTGGFSFIGNYSVGSRPFLAAGLTFNPAWMTVQGNRIESASPAPILVKNQGPLLLLDNLIGSPGSDGPAVSVRSASDADVISAGNRFAASTGLSVRGRLISVDDLAKQSNRFDAPPPLATPPNRRRQVFEVAAGAPSAVIQAAIDSAARLNGQRPVVHLSWGQYSEVAIAVPPGDMQIIGDGQGTQMKGRIMLLGPASHVILRDFRLNGDRAGDGILVQQADQDGGRVYLEQVEACCSGTNILYDGLSRTTLEARDIDHKGAAGSSLRLAGSGTVNIFSGASSNNLLSYSVSGGRLLVRDMWYEGPVRAGFLSASAGSTVTVAGSRIALSYGFSLPAFDLAGFTGIGAILANRQDDRVIVSGASTGKLLVAGVLGPNSDYFQNRSSAQAVLWNGRRTSTGAGTGSLAIPNQGRFDAALLRTALAQTRRELPGAIRDLPAGVTDVRLYRVSLAGFGVGLHIRP